MRSSFPEGYREFILRYWQEEVLAQLDEGLREEPSVSIRLNPKRELIQNLLAADDEMLAEAIEGYDGRVPWCREGLYLKTRPTFTADPLFLAGAYYVQEASSMFIAYVLRSVFSQQLLPNEGGICLDLCAAPGGKSTLLRALLPDAWQLVANEAIRSRAQVLAENLAKWGARNTLVTNLMPAALMERLMGERLLPADLILCDVPCSGEGMFRKEAEAVRQWTPALVEDCAALQREIVQTAWSALRPGGILIYSTCTFNPLEDEANVLWICRELGGAVINIPFDAQWGILRYTDLAREDVLPTDKSSCDAVARCYHFLPGRVRGEGFFCAVIRKSPDADMPAAVLPRTKNKGNKASSQRGKQGGKPAKKPAADPAVLPTDQLDATDAPRVELTIEAALRYLQRESLVLPADTPMGIVTVCYRSQRLGLMNNLGSRANNLYPKEWRIRSGYLTPFSIVR